MKEKGNLSVSLGDSGFSERPLKGGSVSKDRLRGDVRPPSVQIIIAQITVQMNSHMYIKTRLPRCLWKHLFVIGSDIGLGTNSLNLTLKAKATKAKINRWDDIELKNICTAKETTTNEWEKIVANRVSEKELIAKVYQ